MCCRRDQHCTPQHSGLTRQCQLPPSTRTAAITFRWTFIDIMHARCAPAATVVCLVPQVFQAYEQRLPAKAVLELTQRSAVTPGQYAYDCPGEVLLDVSWHWTANTVSGWWQNWLMRPSLNSAFAVRGLVHAGCTRGCRRAAKAWPDCMHYTVFVRLEGHCAHRPSSSSSCAIVHWLVGATHCGSVCHHHSHVLASCACFSCGC
jgi:hypothetical protein